MTSGQETERVHSYNPGARTGQLGEDRCTQFRVIVVTDLPTHKPTDRTDYNTLRRGVIMTGKMCIRQRWERRVSAAVTVPHPHHHDHVDDDVECTVNIGDKHRLPARSPVHRFHRHNLHNPVGNFPQSIILLCGSVAEWLGRWTCNQ